MTQPDTDELEKRIAASIRWHTSFVSGNAKTISIAVLKKDANKNILESEQDTLKEIMRIIQAEIDRARGEVGLDRESVIAKEAAALQDKSQRQLQKLQELYEIYLPKDLPGRAAFIRRVEQKIANDLLALLPKKQDIRPMDNGVPVETYGYEETYNQAIDHCAKAIREYFGMVSRRKSNA